MQLIKAIAIFSLVATGFAAAVPEAEAGVNLEKRGYGCPNDDRCSDYCTSIKRNGGHCGGFAWATCQCNEKS